MLPILMKCIYQVLLILQWKHSSVVPSGHKYKVLSGRIMVLSASRQLRKPTCLFQAKYSFFFFFFPFLMLSLMWMWVCWMLSYRSSIFLFLFGNKPEQLKSVNWQNCIHVNGATALTGLQCSCCLASRFLRLLKMDALNFQRLTRCCNHTILILLGCVIQCAVMLKLD